MEDKELTVKEMWNNLFPERVLPKLLSPDEEAKFPPKVLLRHPKTLIPGIIVGAEMGKIKVKFDAEEDFKRLYEQQPGHIKGSVSVPIEEIKTKGKLIMIEDPTANLKSKEKINYLFSQALKYDIYYDDTALLDCVRRGHYKFIKEQRTKIDEFLDYLTDMRVKWFMDTLKESGYKYIIELFHGSKLQKSLLEDAKIRIIVKGGAEYLYAGQTELGRFEINYEW